MNLSVYLFIFASSFASSFSFASSSSSASFSSCGLILAVIIRRVIVYSPFLFFLATGLVKEKGIRRRCRRLRRKLCLENRGLGWAGPATSLKVDRVEKENGDEKERI